MSLENRIGQILFNISPNNTKKIIMKSYISLESDYVKFQFVIIDNKDNLDTIFISSEVSDDLFRLLVGLKKYYLDNNLTNGQPIWLGCEVFVDLEKMKIHFDMKYTEEEVEEMFED